MQSNYPGAEFVRTAYQVRKNLPCGTKFLRVLIFAIFAVFFAIPKNTFPQNKITANSFSAKIYSTVEIIYKNTGLKEKML